MRLGGPTFQKYDNPEGWIAAVQQAGYRASDCPVKPDADADAIRTYAQAARQANIVIAEVGAWSNPLSPDAGIASEARLYCQKALALADAIGARCCVNICGSRGTQWDGPHPDNLTSQTFELVVANVRTIIDAVKPTRSFYTLETMPWMFPDSPESYLQLVKAIDRKQFGVHLDPVNLICSPQRYFGNGELIRECFAKLGPWIKSCHAKDILLSGKLTTHLDEVRPGLGGLDYRAFLTCVNRLEADTPVMLEHLPSPEEYLAAAAHVRKVAAESGLKL